jgi:hypothetical protein
MSLAFHQAVPTLLEAGGGFVILAAIVAFLAAVFKN